MTVRSCRDPQRWFWWTGVEGAGWLERLVYTQKVIGSSPVRSTGGVASEFCQLPHLSQGGERINHTASPPCGAGWREAHLAELADALDLGSSVFDVWVRVPSRAQLPIPGRF